MKLAVCAQGEGLNAVTDQRFGRCPYFLIVDPDHMETAVSVRNSNVDVAGGAGPQAVQLLSGMGVEAVVLGNVGPKASAALEAAKIRAYRGITGSVETTVQMFREGKLQPVSEASV